MFQIKIENKVVDINPGMIITLNRFNPIFDFNEIQGAKVYDFALPFTPRNDKILGYLNNPQVSWKSKDLFCEKYVHGELIERGFVEVKEVTNSGYNIIYTQNLGEIFGDFQKLPLNLIDFGSEPIPGALTASANHLTDKYCFPAVSNPAFYGTAIPPTYNGYMNEYTSGAYVATAPKVPFLFLRWVLEQIGTLCNFTFEGDFVADAIMKRLVFYNTFSLDGRTTIEYRNHLPEITIPDLLKELRKLFNLGLFFDVRSRVLRMKYVDDILAAPTTLNWSKKFAPVANRAPELATRLELDWEVDGNDGLMKVRPSDYDKYTSVGEGLLFPIKTRFSAPDVDGNGRIKVEQPGITPVNNQLNNRFGPRLAFWADMVGGIPTASNQYGGYRLAWHGANNLVSNFWAGFEAFRNNTFRRVMLGDLTATDIAMIDMHRRAGETMAVHIHGRDYIIGNQRINLPLRGVSELELWAR